MQRTITRWLPAIAKNSYRKATLSVAGLACVAGLAAVPAAYAMPVTGEAHPGAVAAIDLATGRAKTAADPSASSHAGSAAADKNDNKADKNDNQAANSADKNDNKAGRSRKPTMDELVPYGVQGMQSRIPLDDAQLANARAIVKTAKKTGVGERGAVIGVATALQESKLYNLGNLGAINDHDSQGLFQQRPSAGWGTPEEITDPEYASTAFFTALKNVDGWRGMPLTAAAQTVQVSGFPFAYAQWEQQAADIVQQIWTD